MTDNLSSVLIVHLFVNNLLVKIITPHISGVICRLMGCRVYQLNGAGHARKYELQNNR
jgi:hypothetical protein